MMKVLFVDNLFTRNLSCQDKFLVNKVVYKENLHYFMTIKAHAQGLTFDPNAKISN